MLGRHFDRVERKAHMVHTHYGAHFTRPFLKAHMAVTLLLFTLGSTGAQLTSFITPTGWLSGS